MELSGYFETRLPQILTEHAHLLAWQVRYGVFLTETPIPGHWLIDLTRSPPVCEPLSGREVDCSIHLSAADFGKLLMNPMAGRELIAAGRMSVSGRLEYAHHLPTLLALTTSDVPVRGLEYLLGKSAAAQLCAADSPNRHFVVHGDVSNHAELHSILGHVDVESILNTWQGIVRLADKYSGRAISAIQAKHHYRKGDHLAFAHVESHFPSLRAWGCRMRLELGLPVNTYHRNLLYASPTGAGEGMHFDQNLNIVVQLKGRKLWRLAANRHVECPNDRYALAFGIVSEDLREYSKLPFPQEMPRDAEEVILEPGSVLVLPRGVWHETQALDDSLSLNFTFDQPSWVDVLVPEIRRHLLAMPAFRATVAGAATPANCEGKAQLRGLLHHLGDLTERISESALDRLKPVSSDPPRRIDG